MYETCGADRRITDMFSTGVRQARSPKGQRLHARKGLSIGRYFGLAGHDVVKTKVALSDPGHTEAGMVTTYIPLCITTIRLGVVRRQDSSVKTGLPKCSRIGTRTISNWSSDSACTVRGEIRLRL
jgi:hypothetical protein